MRSDREKSPVKSTLVLLPFVSCTARAPFADQWKIVSAFIQPSFTFQTFFTVLLYGIQLSILKTVTLYGGCGACVCVGGGGGGGLVCGLRTNGIGRMPRSLPWQSPWGGAVGVGVSQFCSRGQDIGVDGHGLGVFLAGLVCRYTPSRQRRSSADITILPRTKSSTHRYV